MESLLTAAAEGGSPALSFVIIVPSHLEAIEKEQQVRKRSRAGEPAAAAATPLAAMLASRFCRGSTVCAAERTCFVDGHQHLLRNPYFTIATDTHLLVLSSSPLPTATEALEMVRDTWYGVMVPPAPVVVETAEKEGN